MAFGEQGCLDDPTVIQAVLPSTGFTATAVNSSERGAPCCLHQFVRSNDVLLSALPGPDSEGPPVCCLARSTAGPTDAVQGTGSGAVSKPLGAGLLLLHHCPAARPPPARRIVRRAPHL